MLSLGVSKSRCNKIRMRHSEWSSPIEENPAVMREIEYNHLCKIIDSLSNCPCCPRHQLNRPYTLAPWVELPFSNTQFTPCECDCRHRSRMICRNFYAKGGPSPIPPASPPQPNSSKKDLERKRRDGEEENPPKRTWTEADFEAALVEMGWEQS